MHMHNLCAMKIFPEEIFFCPLHIPDEFKDKASRDPIHTPSPAPSSSSSDYTIYRSCIPNFPNGSILTCRTGGQFTLLHTSAKHSWCLYYSVNRLNNGVFDGIERGNNGVPLAKCDIDDEVARAAALKEEVTKFVRSSNASAHSIHVDIDAVVDPNGSLTEEERAIKREAFIDTHFSVKDEYATEIDVSALAHVIMKPIMVMYLTTEGDLVPSHPEPFGIDYGVENTIHLCFSGPLQKGHYSILRPVSVSVQ